MYKHDVKADELILVRDLLGGSERALRTFYRTYAPRLKVFIQNKIGSAEDVEEVLQDSLLSALDSLALYSGRSSIFTWLCGIARHEIADFYRKQKIKTVVFSRLPFIEGFVSKALGPSAVMMRREYERQVVEALEMILPHYREILELKYMDGLSVKEIAKKLGMSFKACESALTRARRAFEMAYEKTR
jgi:RNA polymerase sigma-70 factor (ECF subfamily)